VRSRIVAGTIFVEHDFLIMSVKLAPGISIGLIFYKNVHLPRARSAGPAIQDVAPGAPGSRYVPSLFSFTPSLPVHSPSSAFSFSYQSDLAPHLHRPFPGPDAFIAFSVPRRPNVRTRGVGCGPGLILPDLDLRLTPAALPPPLESDYHKVMAI
jgi:hypothetical protein